MFFIEKEELEKLYFDDRLSYSQIEKILKLKRGRIYNWFKKYKIEARNSSESSKGRVFSEEHKKRISKSNSKPHTEERKLNISKSKKGQKISEETKEKIRTKLIGLRVGNKHPMWKGGTSIMRNRLRQSFQYKKWRMSVYERDKFICQLCFESGKYLNCHHIETLKHISEKFNLSKYEDFLNCGKLWDIKNGITLCKKCHENLINNKEKEYEEYFKKIIERYENKENGKAN